MLQTVAKQLLVFCHDTISTMKGGGGEGGLESARLFYKVFITRACEFVLQGKVVSASYVQDCGFLCTLNFFCLYLYTAKNDQPVQDLRNRKHFPFFYRVIETRVEVWEKQEIAWEHEHEVRVFPRNFEFLPNFHKCF